VAKYLLDDADVHALLDQQRRSGMPGIMNPGIPKPGLPEDRLPGPPVLGTLDRTAMPRGEYQIMILPGVACLQPLSCLPLAVLLEEIQDRAREIPDVRWATVAITFTVGIASGFMGYFKYKERSFYLQQTADTIESEWEAVEVGVGRYAREEDENVRLALFVEEVHRLKSEQRNASRTLSSLRIRIAVKSKHSL
jgi:hypothetical protein